MLSFAGNQAVYLQNSLDANFSSVLLLLAGEDTPDTTTFTDSSSYKRTKSSSTVSINTATQAKFGKGSIYQTGTNQEVTFPTDTVWSGNALATSIWTLECWVYLPQGLVGTFNSAELANPSGARGNTSWFPTYIGVYTGNGSIQGVTTAPAANTWHYIAICKNTTANNTTTSSYDIYLNGTRLYIGTGVTWLTGNTTQTWQMGRADGAARPGKYIDDYRFTMGLARYSGPTMTVPIRSHGIAKL